MPLASVGCLFRFHVRQQAGDRLLHHARRLHHLRQEHFSRAEQVADDIHAGHQRAFDDMQRALGLQPRLVGVGVDELGDAVDQRMADALLDRPVAPGEVTLLRFLAGRSLEALGDLQHALGRRAAGLRHAVEHHVLAGLAQLRLDRVVDGELAGIDDAHVHAALDGVVEEHGVHGLAHRLVAAEREGEVRDAARDVDMRQRRGDLAGRLDEVDAVIVVLLDARRHRKDVRIEDDVFRREAGLLGQQLVGARADLDLARLGVGLALLVEGHDDDGRAIHAAELGVMEESLLAFLHRDRVDDRLALHAFQAGLDHLPFGAVDHHRHACDVRLGGDEVEVFDHRLLRVDQALVHVDVDDLRAIGDLVARDVERRGVVAGRDQLPELGRARDVGALADIDEGNLLGQRERLEAGEHHQRLVLGRAARRMPADGFGDGA